MDTALVSALAAVMGSLVGGSATIATAWITQKTQSRRDVLNAELRKRETLYSEFITECSKLTIDALDHSLDDPEKAFVVYALENRIRLTSTAPVVEAADQAVGKIMAQVLRAEPHEGPDEGDGTLPADIFSEAFQRGLPAGARRPAPRYRMRDYDHD